MPTLTLRALSASAFTTKGSALDSTEFDNNFIQLKAEIDALNTALGAITAHVKNQDTKLNEGGANEVSAAELKVVVDDHYAPVGAADALKNIRINSAGTGLEASEVVHGAFHEEGNVNATTISVAGTFENIDCNLADGDAAVQNLSVAANVITYSGTNVATLLINWSATALKTGGGSADQCRIALFVDGSEQAAYGVRDIDNSSLGSLSMSAIIEVSNGLDIALKITNDDSTSDIKVQDQTVTIIKIK